MGNTPTPKLVLSQIKRLERYLNSLNVIPATGRHRTAVILALLSKALTVGRAICLLVEHGFHGEALAMSRTLIEIYFCVRYITNKDTENRARTYVNYHARVRQEWQSIIMKYYPNTPVGSIALEAEVLEAAREFKNKAHWTGHGGQAKLMALEEDTVEQDEFGQPAKSEFDYDALYFWTSHYVHATVVGIEGHASERGEVFKVRAGIELEHKLGADALFNTIVFLCKTFLSACRAMNEDQPEAVLAMQKLISKFARGTVTASPVGDP